MYISKLVLYLGVILFSRNFRRNNLDVSKLTIGSLWYQNGSLMQLLDLPIPSLIKHLVWGWSDQTPFRAQKHLDNGTETIMSSVAWSVKNDLIWGNFGLSMVWSEATSTGQWFGIDLGQGRSNESIMVCFGSHQSLLPSEMF